MAKIEISEIRNSSVSMVELNEGHLLYQRKQYENLEFNIIKIPTLTFIASAFFDGKKVELKYTKEPLTNSKLYRNEICLYFIIRDEINNIFKDKESEFRFFEEAKQDELIQELMEINITRNIFEYEITPIFSIYNNELYLEFEFSCNKFRKTFIDVLKLLLMIESKSEIKDAEDSYLLDYKYFSSESQKLLDLTYLNRNSIEFKLGKTNVNCEYLTFIYQIYKENIYFKDNEHLKKLSFVTGLPNDLKINLKDKTLSLTHYNFKLLMTHSKSFIFMFDKCYVVSGNDKMIVTLYKLLLEQYKIKLSDNNFEIFLNNIYNSYKDYIKYDNYHPTSDIKITTYFDYDNSKLSIKYDDNFASDKFYLKKKNYKLLIKNLGFTKANDYSITDFDMICEILNNKIDLLRKYGDVYVSDTIKNMKFHKMSDNKLRFKLDDSIIKLSFEDQKYSQEELKDILIAYKQDKKYIKLKDGSIIEIDKESAKLYSELQEDLGMKEFSDDIKVPLYKAYYLESKYKDIINSNKKLDEFSENLINYKKYNVSLNKDLDNVLREYQKDGFKWLSVLANYNLGGILADDMGLGKTVEIISLIDTLERDRPYLIVAPTSLIFNWELEFKKFAPHIGVKVIYGLNRTKEEITKAYDENKVLITSYDSLRLDSHNYKGLKFRLMAVDEAQYIKNPDALKTIAVKEIEADTRFALTGTPIENSLLDLWSIFDFVLPGYLKPKNEFIKYYQNFKTNETLNELNKKASPFVLRRLKGDVLDLEDKVESYSISVMTDEERKLYDKYLLTAKNELSSSFSISHVLSIITRLRELACEPRLFLNDVNTPNSKMDLMMEIVKEKIENGHKILIFSQFTSIFPFMEKRLNEANIKYLVLTGKTDGKERIKLVSEFNENEDIKVFLISLKAGGTGLNLTSADTVIHYDPWWNLAAMNQATDRAHRIGQKNIVHVIKMINKDTIEEKIIDLQNKKKLLSEEVINDEDIVGRLTKDDIKELFK